MNTIRAGFLGVILLTTLSSFASSDSLSGRNNTLNPKRLTVIVASETVLGAGSLIGLNALWYADYPRSSLHLFNDNKEWRGMDKCGHSMTAYYMGKVGYESLRWSGVPQGKAAWAGSLMGWVYLGTVEIFDGCSEEWGFSTGDLLANTLGSAVFLGQQAAWKEQRVLLKWSFHTTTYAHYNPGLLGEKVSQNVLKDYNGQTYWLSANIKSFLREESHFPCWVNLAVGYGAEGMLGARSNPGMINGQPVPSFKRYSQFYIAPDIDLTRIPVRSKTLHLLLNAIGFIKFPLPALEINPSGMRFHYLYF